MNALNLTLPHLTASDVHARLLAPHEADMMLVFREDNRRHLEHWEPSRPAEFYSLGFWQINLRLHLRDFRDGHSVCFALLNPEETEVLGVCNYTNIVRGTFQSCHLGYALAEKHQGTGLMFRALSLTNDYIFSTIRLNRIMAAYLPHNDRSGALLNRLGFEKEGFARRYLKINGRWEDHVLTALLNQTYS